MKINRQDLNNLIEESVTKIRKRQKIEAEIKMLEESLFALNKPLLKETSSGINPAPMQDIIQQVPTSNIRDTGGTLGMNLGVEKKTEKLESVFDTRPNDIIIFNFQDCTIKLRRISDDLFQVIDAEESLKLQDGDYIQIKGNDIIQNGRQFVFTILRKAINYKSRPLVGWRIVKN